MSQAAKYLTPVCLELGGKNPTIVDDTIDPRYVAEQLLWVFIHFVFCFLFLFSFVFIIKKKKKN